MDYILKAFKMRCKEEFGEYGFKSYRSNHYRVINDIFQSFNLHKSVSGSACTVEFGIIPLSVNYELNKLSCNPYHLKKFENMNEWFCYDGNSAASIDVCVENMIAYMRKFLMPLFEKATDCKSAYDAIVEHDKIFTGNSYERFCMCLKFEDYQSAKTYIESVIRQHEYAFERNKEFLGENITQAYIQKMEKKIADKKHWLNLIINKDYQIIQRMIEANERRNQENLGIKGF